jgi:hypothetical protein
MNEKPSSTFLSDVQGFTPVIDVLAQETSPATALVYGVVWRYCQMNDGLCRASVASIAQRIGLHAKTTRRHLKKLCQLGYLQDTTPARRHGPHLYRDTGTERILALAQTRCVAPAPAGTAAPPELTKIVTAGQDPVPAELPQTPTELSQTPPAPHRSPQTSHSMDKTSHSMDKTSHPGGTKRPTKKEHEERINQDTASAAGAATALAPARHPAIQAFRKNAHRYPAKSWFEDVAATVGQDPADLQFWGQVVKAWVGCGYNPLNVRGMLDCYKRRELPSTGACHPGRASQKRPATRLQGTIDAAVRILQQEGEWPP